MGGFVFCTDPIEGAALAMSILEALREKGVRMAATTHYAELKAFALQTPGVENGCCEFDVATLRPTYRLLIGVPGRSNAFAISLRLGMEPSIVERAKSLVSEENSQFEDVVQNLEASRQKLEFAYLDPMYFIFSGAVSNDRQFMVGYIGVCVQNESDFGEQVGSVLSFDWKGRPQKAYDFESDIVSFDMDWKNNVMYCIENRPEPEIVAYRLDDLK